MNRLHQALGALQQRFHSRGSRGFLTVGAAGTVLLTALVITFGAPQHARLLDLLTGHGWLTTDQPDQVMLANGQTGQLDFRLTVGRSGDPVDVVQSGQNALLVDGKTGQAGAIDVSSLKIVNSSELAPGGSLGTSAQPTVKNQVLPGPKGTFYIVHRRTGEVEITDPLTDKTLATARLGGALSPAVDAGGTLWTVTTGTGAMVGVDYRGHALHEDTVHSSVVGPGNDVQLSVVDGAPAVLDKSRNVFFTAPGGVPGPAVTLPSDLGPRATVASIVTGPVVPIAAPGKVVLVSDDKADVVELNGRSSDQLGAPAAFADRIYVPDLSDGSVVVLNDAGQQVGTPIDVTKGAAPQLSLSVQNGALFINNPASPTAYSVTTDGDAHLIAKTDPNVPSTQTLLTTPTTLPSVPTTVPAPPPPLPVTVPATVTPTTSGVPGGSTPSSVPTSGSRPSSTPPTAATVPASVPAAPGSPAASAGDKSAHVSWSAPATHGSPITGYAVSWTVAGGGSISVPGSALSATITGLKNGTSYVFTVVAANAVGKGPGAQTSPVVPSATSPDPPSNVHAVANGNGSVTVSWTAANGQGLTIGHYHVVASPAIPTSVTTTGLVTSVTISRTSGLKPQTSYTFSVESVTTAGVASSPSSSSSSVTTAAEAPTKVAVQVLRSGERQLTVTVTGNAAGQAASLSLSGAVTDSSTIAATASGTFTVTTAFTVAWGTTGPISASVCAKTSCATPATSTAVDVNVPSITAVTFNWDSACETNPNKPPAFHGYVGSYSFTLDTNGLPSQYVSGESATLTYYRTSANGGGTATSPSQTWSYQPTVGSYGNLHGGFWHEGYRNHFTVKFNVAGYGSITKSITTTFPAC